jgi:hypothetical protein
MEKARKVLENPRIFPKKGEYAEMAFTSTTIVFGAEVIFGSSTVDRKIVGGAIITLFEPNSIETEFKVPKDVYCETNILEILEETLKLLYVTVPMKFYHEIGDQPFYSLDFIAVLLEYGGRGIGSKILEEIAKKVTQT